MTLLSRIRAALSPSPSSRIEPVVFVYDFTVEPFPYDSKSITVRAWIYSRGGTRPVEPNWVNFFSIDDLSDPSFITDVLDYTAIIHSERATAEKRLNEWLVSNGKPSISQR